MRLQLAINVGNLDEAIDFYTKMFDTEPAKIRAGYANFVITQPPLKLVLFEGAGDGGTINHLGVETESADEVQTADRRLRAAGVETSGIDETMCCYADKTETWVSAPDGLQWEWYVKTGDNEQFESISVGADSTKASGSACC